jgi:hypothetical protein
MIQVPGPANEFDNYLTSPSVIYMDFLDTIQNIQFPFITDAFLNGSYQSRVFGGVAKNVVGLNGQVVTGYNLVITRYVQNIITRNTPNFPLYLYAPYTVSYPSLRLGFGVNRLSQGRVKLGGGTHSSQKIKLRIIYSKI